MNSAYLWHSLLVDPTLPDDRLPHDVFTDFEKMVASILDPEGDTPHAVWLHKGNIDYRRIPQVFLERLVATQTDTALQKIGNYLFEFESMKSREPLEDLIFNMVIQDRTTLGEIVREYLPKNMNDEEREEIEGALDIALEEEWRKIQQTRARINAIRKNLADGTLVLETQFEHEPLEYASKKEKEQAKRLVTEMIRKTFRPPGPKQP